MNEKFLLKINKITMYIWLGMAIFGVIAALVCYFKYDSEGMMTPLLIILISSAMFGWKKFQISKFGAKSE